ncbi:hypothetical protein BKA67DRAFT_654414 [Truncatella angustata]|uniref:Uncharacterized protein n=1 Tax=Truncatella angustata TaxID=152316 RepID=A0A9P9A492_9PEZI|nr:uncharacterized protein BKA67DRAFT_654414 [Truncatella angustata]KAH6661292.1 hypothetical protein BKA67DRAFT_654414 [Truncatella angustata]
MFDLVGLLVCVFAHTLEYAPLALIGYCVWFQVEQVLFKRKLAAYKPVPIPEICPYTSDQVSVIACTVDTLLASSLRTWLANNPLEVIIVTVPKHIEHIRLVVDNAQLTPADFEKVTIVASPEMGKRPQLVLGINNARGSVFGLVDDHIAWGPRFLEAMLPCFQDQRVGAISPEIDAIIPEERRNPDIISPWEVMAMRVRWNSNPRLKVAYAAARWAWGICGVTGVYRAEILKDPVFIDAYRNELWFGKKIDIGEDNFISRWLQSHDWIIAIQALPETVVSRTVKRTSDFLLQMCRWERSTILTHLRQLLEVKRTRRSLFVFRKTLGRIIRPVITWTYIFFFTLSMWTKPIVPLIIFVFYVHKTYPTYEFFFAKHPYMRRYWWAVIAQDLFHVVQDPICWLTLGNVTWEARKVTAEEQNNIK